jgi:hypothetical protein
MTSFLLYEILGLGETTTVEEIVIKSGKRSTFSYSLPLSPFCKSQSGERANLQASLAYTWRTLFPLERRISQNKVAYRSCDEFG